MALYRYKAYDRQGHSVEGEMPGESAQEVSVALNGQGFIPIRISALKSGFFSSQEIFQSKVKLTELNMFTKQLYTLQKAGLPLLSGLSALKDQTDNQYFKKIILAVIRDLENGSSLSEAMARHPKVFNPLYSGLVKVGEASGKLENVLSQLADIGEFEAQVKEKIRAATLYPIIALCSIIIAFTIVVTFVIPRFANLYGKFSSQLPLPTRVLLAINNTVRHEWYIVLAVIGFLIFLFRRWVATPSGHYYWDLFKIRVPIFGPLVFNLLMSRFSKILSELFSSGLPILQSLQLVSETVGNVVIEKAIMQIQKSVNEGKGMAAPMKNQGFFSPMVVQMVAVGEQTGKTEELLNFISNYYEEQANYMIKNLSTLIEPILIVILGGMVLVLALGVFLPMWNLTNVVR